MIWPSQTISSGGKKKKLHVIQTFYLFFQSYQFPSCKVYIYFQISTGNQTLNISSLIFFCTPVNSRAEFQDKDVKKCSVNGLFRSVVSKQEPLHGYRKDPIGPQVNIYLISNTGISRQVQIQVPPFLQTDMDLRCVKVSMMKIVRMHLRLKESICRHFRDLKVKIIFYNKFCN